MAEAPEGKSGPTAINQAGPLAHPNKSTLSPSQERTERLFDPSQEHTGLSLGVDDFHGARWAGTFASRIFPDDLIFPMTISAVDHTALRA